MRNINGSKAKYILALGLIIIGLTGCDQIGGNAPKIAYVNVAKALSESSVGKQELKRNQDVKEVLLKAENAAKEKYKTMPDKQQQQSRDADNITLNQLWLAEQQHSRELSIKAIAEAAETYRTSHNIDYIMVSTSMLAARENTGVTSEIIKQVEKTTVNYGDLPKIDVSNGQNDVGKNIEIPQADKQDTSDAH
jgi:Skp family chaperone for outer membrane proteins